MRTILSNGLFLFLVFFAGGYGISQSPQDTFPPDDDGFSAVNAPVDYEAPPLERTMMSDDQKRLAEEKAAAIVASIVRPEMTEFEKVLTLHEYMTSTMTYGKFNGAQTNAYTALVHRRSDCVGFARGMAALLDKAGIQNTVIVRRKGHLWNQVVIRRQCQYIDTTWSNLRSGWGQFSWFLLSQAQNSSAPYHDLDSGEKYQTCPSPFEFRESDYPHRELLRSPDRLRLMGTVFLPDGETAPTGGLLLNVNGNRTMIPENENSAFFIATVARREQNKAKLNYFIPNSTEYAKTGYYSPGGTVFGERNGAAFDVSGPDITNLRLAVVRSQNFVSGMISLPPGFRAPDSGITITVQLDGYRLSNRVTYTDRIKLNPGEVSAAFKIDVSPADSDRVFKLYTWSSSAASNGYEKSTRYPADLRFTQPGLTEKNIILTRTR